MMEYKKLAPGTKINRLTIIKYDHSDSRNRRHYLCRCDCGKEKTIQGSLITSGNTKSCGCLGIEARANRIKLPDHGGCVNNLILQYKRGARDRGLEYNLTRELFVELIYMPCDYCNRPPSNFKTTKNDSVGIFYSGIDRIDPTKGYTKDNVVPCCKMCNRSKNDRSKEDFLNWVKSVYIHQSKVH